MRGTPWRTPYARRSRHASRSSSGSSAVKLSSVEFSFRWYRTFALALAFACVLLFFFLAAIARTYPDPVKQSSGPYRVPPQAQVRQDTRARRHVEKGPGRPALRGAEARRQPRALRL